MRLGKLSGSSLLFLSSLALAPSVSHAEDREPAKSVQNPQPISGKEGYWLFNPTPRDKMRAFSTDRPDKTESPYSVDAGHFQFEADLVNYVYDKAENGDVTQTANVAYVNFKLGITNSMDFQTMVPFYGWQRSRMGTESVTDRGIGDVTFRLKWNLYGNDDVGTSLGVMPFFTPTTSEGGLIGLAAFELPAEWGLGTMAVIERKTSENDTGATAFTGTVTFAHSIIGALDGYLELFGQQSTAAGSSFAMTFDAGLTFDLLPDLRLDAGVNIGVTEAADDFNPFLGLSGRI